MDEEYIKLVISQIRSGMNEDQALEIIKELIKNNGKKPIELIKVAEVSSFWEIDYTNTRSKEQNIFDTITMLDLESI